MNEAIEGIRGGLVVSCQVPRGHPLRDPGIMALFAQCAKLGGAAGLRVNGPDDIAAVRRRSALPVIGLFKVPGDARDFITPGFDEAAELAGAGAQIVAVEATGEVPGDPLALIRRIRDELGLPVMADIATLEEGLRARDAGADLVGTTLSGYTSATRSDVPGPDLRLVGDLAARGVPTIAEGRYATRTDVASAFEAGAWSVVVGTAITDPVAITHNLVQATPRSGAGNV